jgi:hypothetical protein
MAIVATFAAAALVALARGARSVGEGADPPPDDPPADPPSDDVAEVVVA